MQMIYNSPNYCVVEFKDDGGERGGFEIMDKAARREIFLEGALAQSFREGVEALIRSQPTPEEIDDYIGRYTELAQHPVVLH